MRWRHGEDTRVHRPGHWRHRGAANPPDPDRAAARRHLRPAGQLLLLLSAGHLDHPEHPPDAGACPVPALTVSIKADRWIKGLGVEHRMVEPFVDSQMRTGVISYGVSS